jgi:hypothetical protein
VLTGFVAFAKELTANELIAFIVAPPGSVKRLASLDEIGLNERSFLLNLAITKSKRHAARLASRLLIVLRFFPLGEKLHHVGIRKFG